MASSNKHLSVLIALASIIGLTLSFYTYYLLVVLEEDDEYEAICDISEHFSCTKVAQSEYSRGFGLVASYFGSRSFLNQPNGLYGLFFYTIESILGYSTNKWAVKTQAVLSILSIGISSWLEYVLFFVLREVCVVCVALYIINLIIVALSIIRYKQLGQLKPAASNGTKKKAPAKKGRTKKE